MRLVFLVLYFFGTVWAGPYLKNTLANPKTIHPRIIGGTLANSGQFPFNAAIYTITPTGTYFCSGTLYSNQWVITAAFCLTDVTSFIVELGSTHLNSDDVNRIRIATDKKIIHPNYDPITLANNIGLIKFRLPVTLSVYVRPIDYLAFAEVSPSASGQAIGWGQTSDESAGLVDDLHWAYVSALSNEECKNYYGSQISDDMLCVEGNYNEGICNGDIGGPLVQVISRGHYVLVGVASFLSQNGCQSVDPSGYTRVYPFADWIKNTTLEA